MVGLRAIGSGSGPGATAFEAPDLVLERVHLEGFLDGLYLERSDGVHVLDATLLGSGRYGVHLMFNRGARLERVRAADFDANGFGAVLQRLPAAFDARERDLDTTLAIEARRFRRNAFDLALYDDGADVVLRGNAYDRAPPLDLDGDGTLDAPFVVGTSLGALAARVPDVRFEMLVDHAPRAEPVEPGAPAAGTWLLVLLPLAGAAWALWPSWAPAARHGREP